MTYLLDTNHASQLIDPDHALWTRLRVAIEGGATVLLPLPVLEEIRFGIESARDPVRRSKREAALAQVLTALPTVGISVEEALESGRLRGWLRRMGKQIGPVDANLAALARLNGYILLTDDGDFTPLAGEIAIENWLR